MTTAHRKQEDRRNKVYSTGKYYWSIVPFNTWDQALVRLFNHFRLDELIRRIECSKIGMGLAGTKSPDEIHKILLIEYSKRQVLTYMTIHSFISTM